MTHPAQSIEWARWLEVIVPAVLTALNCAFVVGVWFISQKKASKEEVQEVEERVLALENWRANAPGWDEVNTSKDGIGRLQGEVRTLGAKVDGMGATLTTKIDGVAGAQKATAATLQRLNDYLLQREGA